MTAANLLQPILEGFCSTVGFIIGNQGLWNAFAAKPFAKNLNSEVSISFRREKDFRLPGIGIHHDKCKVPLQEKTTISCMHS